MKGWGLRGWGYRLGFGGLGLRVGVLNLNWGWGFGIWDLELGYRILKKGFRLRALGFGARGLGNTVRFGGWGLGVGGHWGVRVTVWVLGLGFSGACVQKSEVDRTLSNTRQHGGACVERKLSECRCVQISIPASNEAFLTAARLLL